VDGKTAESPAQERSEGGTTIALRCQVPVTRLSSSQTQESLSLFPIETEMQTTQLADRNNTLQHAAICCNELQRTGVR